MRGIGGSWKVVLQTKWGLELWQEKTKMRKEEAPGRPSRLLTSALVPVSAAALATSLSCGAERRGVVSDPAVWPQRRAPAPPFRFLLCKMGPVSPILPSSLQTTLRPRVRITSEVEGRRGQNGRLGDFKWLPWPLWGVGTESKWEEGTSNSESFLKGKSEI